MPVRVCHCGVLHTRLVYFTFVVFLSPIIVLLMLLLLLPGQQRRRLFHGPSESQQGLGGWGQLCECGAAAAAPVHQRCNAMIGCSLSVCAHCTHPNWHGHVGEMGMRVLPSLATCTHVLQRAWLVRLCLRRAIAACRRLILQA